ncbi:MAG: dolichyl-phosphate beta-glucosyltransferase [Candidatus Villigracilaceae bacterium]
MNESPVVSVVLPAFNEENLIAGTLASLDAFLAERFARYEIIVVDDGSCDQTAKIVRRWRPSGKAQLRLLVNEINLGKGYAIQRGVLSSRAPFIVFMDADLPYRLEAIDLFLQALQNGCDLAIGSRVLAGSHVEGVPPLRFVAGQIFSWLVQALLFRGLPDTQCGFKAFTAQAAREIFSRLTIRGFGFDVEALYLARKFGFKIQAVPVQMTTTYRRDSRVRLPSDSLRMFLNLFQVRWNDLRGRYK